ncbi:spermine/spermidine synthase domain containing protein [Nitzschia inconspicua]|uniref:Spermine/spermidine synthase domain containing protein n=1 Tax=Nitzschia inconspicua TaxID=303405 RepID=A0A9K3L8M7_9STRA|nr:spermine/spermidine synthase domain containing protein [Nitzschia inconspicua]
MAPTRVPNGRGNKDSNGRQGTPQDDGFRVKVTTRFIILCLLSCTLLAYAVGKIARLILIDGPHQQLALIHEQQLSSLGGSYELSSTGNSRDHVMKLPNPVLKNKPIPNTIYTSMNFDTSRSSSINSRWVVVEESDSPPQILVPGTNQTCDADNVETCSSCSRGKEPVVIESSGEDHEEVHLPAGQHLLMDIRNVQSEFLASEERLATAMLDVVGDCGLTLLSYHCHGLQPSGVSCVGVLLESHVSFHTWPSQGVVTLDLFTCGSQSLLPIVEAVERLFGVPATSDGPETVWAYKVRGFGDETSAELADLFTFPIGTMTEYKKEIISITKKTDDIKRGRIDVYDVLRPTYQTFESYKRSLQNDNSYESQYKEIFQPDRILYVNGVLQSRRSAEVPYHEALVHPGMFAHDNPKRVLLLSCGGGAALREVLKHKTVEKVVMIEEEKQLVSITRELFPEYSDCSTNQGVASANCFDDSRVEVIYSDIFDWAEKENKGYTGDAFDVIILDDSYYVAGPAEYGDFTSLVSKMISDRGVFVAQMGQAPNLNLPSAKHSVMKNRFDFIESLPQFGFKSVVDYEEGHLGFSKPWQFVAAFRDYEMSRTNWFSPISHMDLVISQRIWPTKSGDSSLVHFDAATMQGYSHPNRASEVVFCRTHPDSTFCPEGHGFDPERPNVPATAFDVRASTLGENAGRGVFANEEISQFSYLTLDDAVHPVYFNPLCFDLVTKMVAKLGHEHKIQIMQFYSLYYGHVTSFHGRQESTVDSNRMCFLNHGCSGKSNLSMNLTVTESFDGSEIPQEFLRIQYRHGDEYNPAAERFPTSLTHSSPLRDLKEGEELFINYLAAVNANKWKEEIASLRDQCNGALGDVTAYEREK